MKIQLDTEKKTVKVLETVNLAKLVKFLKILLDKDYNEYILETNAVVYTYTNGWYHWDYYRPLYPIIYGTGITSPDNNVITTTNGLYNIEVNLNIPENE